MTWIWGSISPLGMLTAHSTMWIQRTNTTNTTSTSSKKSLKIQNMATRASSWKSGWMERVAMGLKKSLIPLISGLMPFVRPKEISPSSQLSQPMFVGSEMKRELLEIQFGIRSIRIRFATIHPTVTSITGIQKGSNTQWEKPMFPFAPAGSTMTIKSLSPCAN